VAARRGIVRWVNRTPSTRPAHHDPRNVPFTCYLRLIQSKIDGEPRAAKRRRAVIVLFESRDGQVRDGVEKSPSNSMISQYARGREAQPVPPLPPVSGLLLRVHFGFEFQPGQG
jgi:hypothetical protein